MFFKMFPKPSKMSFKNLLSTLLLSTLINGQFMEYYEKLNVDSGATTKEIRKAFKKLAITMHPDKTDAPDAEEKFREIAEIYEILSDEEKRKTYDRYGEEGLKNNEEKQQRRGSQRSWQYYQNEGLYDDDEQIVTFEDMDSYNAVYSGEDIWFVNYYSTMCSHCHTLAPAWRAMAKQLDGLVNIGAVNCMVSGHLCNKQRLTGYPTMLLFRNGKYEKFSANDRSTKGLVKYILNKINPVVHTVISKEMLDMVLKLEGGVILNVCSSDADCIDSWNWD